MVPKCGTSTLLMMQMMMKSKKPQKTQESPQEMGVKGVWAKVMSPISQMQSSKGTKVVIILCVTGLARVALVMGSLVGFNSVVNMQENPVQNNQDKPQNQSAVLQK